MWDFSPPPSKLSGDCFKVHGLHRQNSASAWLFVFFAASLFFNANRITSYMMFLKLQNNNISSTVSLKK